MINDAIVTDTMPAPFIVRVGLQRYIHRKEQRQ